MIDKNNPFYLQELDMYNNVYKAKEYYDYIIKNVDLDRSNPNNSYIMYEAGKVDSVDETKPVKFIEGKATLPDIDVDFPPQERENVISYLKEKYGEDRVCQMITFSRLQGRSALKEVLRANESCDNDTMNKITENIPDEAAISDQLEEMDNPSIIMWALENDDDELKNFCYLEDGKLKGEYAREFAQAIRIEGTFKAQGKHAAGVIISSEKLDEIVPMVKAARSSEQLAGMDMSDLEAIGCVKFDILGLSLLSKLSAVQKEVNEEKTE